MIKIYRQFGHASIENMTHLLNNASLLNSETSKLIEKVNNSFKTCLIYKKPSHRPVVGLSRATNFNDTVAMDLHQLGKNICYFHFIDKLNVSYRGHQMYLGNGSCVSSKCKKLSHEHKWLQSSSVSFWSKCKTA